MDWSPEFLPNEISEKILYLFPSAEDAVRMSLVSKTFKTLWDSLPLFHYRCYLFGIDDIVISEEDPTLSICNLNQDDDDDQPKRKIGSLMLRSKGGESNYHILDYWIKLVTKHYLIYLDILVILPGGILYPFPCSPNLDLGSLQKLRLGYCALDEALVQKGTTTTLNCLKSLDLYHVELNGILWELLSMCPSLETLGVEFCTNFNDHYRQLYYSIEGKIIVPKLVRTFSFASLSYETNPERLDHVMFKTWDLEVLHIQAPNARLTDLYINTLTSIFPSLVELNLEALGFGREGNNHWRVSSDQLKSLTVVVSRGLGRFKRPIKPIKVNLRTPNLGYFSYCGPIVVPNAFRKQDCMNVKVLKLGIRSGSLDTQWFLAFRKYIGESFLRLEGCTLELSARIAFFRHELKDVEIPLPPKEVNLSLRLPLRNMDMKSIAAILWSVHPSTLSIELLNPSCHDSLLYNYFTMFIEEEFMCWEEYLLLCDYINCKCCWHCLKSVKMKTYFSIKKGERHDEDSFNNLEDQTESIGATFELQWLDA